MRLFAIVTKKDTKQNASRDLFEVRTEHFILTKFLMFIYFIEEKKMAKGLKQNDDV